MPEQGSIDPERLAELIPFQGLGKYDLMVLANQSSLINVPAGYQLFVVGASDRLDYFLLEGEVELVTADGIKRRLRADSEQASRQLARLRPRQYTAVTTKPSELVVVSLDIMEAIAHEEDLSSLTDGYMVDELGSEDDIAELELITDFKIALNQNRFVLPTLPEVALKVKALIEDKDTDINKIADVVNTDPAIAAKLIRAANSPIFFGATQCDTTRNAVVRLGLKTTHQLVVTFAVKELFSCGSGDVQKIMTKAWFRSVEVAAISFVIARRAKRSLYDPEEVMLAGLLHNIGLVAALSYIIQLRPELLESMPALINFLQLLQVPAAEAILQNWHFPEEFIDVVEQLDNWGRQHASSSDICDVIQVAKLHAMLRNREHLPVERLDLLPSFQRLACGELGPKLSLQILAEAEDQIKQTQLMLNP